MPLRRTCYDGDPSMTMTRAFVAVTAGLILLCASCHAQLWSGILAPSRAVDWKDAGISSRIPDRPAVCAKLSPGAGSAEFNRAIASCPAGQTVYVSPGKYHLANGISFGTRNDVTLRGAGPDRTVLSFAGADSCKGLYSDVCIAGSTAYWTGHALVQPGAVNAARWTAGYTKGTIAITLDNTRGLTPGTLLTLDQANDTADHGGFLVCDRPGLCRPASESGSPGRKVDNISRSQQQIVRVTAVRGKTVTITPGLYASNWSADKSPGAWWSGPPVTGVGIEDLALDHSGSKAMSGVAFFNAYQCWIRNVASINARRNHVWLVQSARLEVRDSYFYGGQGSASQSYGVESYITSDDLILNNIFQHVTAPVMMAPAAGIVTAYNFMTDMYYTAPVDWLSGSMWMHDAGAMFNLFEGNSGTQFIQDAFHGTSVTATLFRNHLRGAEPGKRRATYPLDLMTYSRYDNVIANVLGTPGYHTTYEVSSATARGDVNRSIYVLGYPGVLQGSFPDVPYDPKVRETLMRWGNYDAATGTVRWESAEVPSRLAAYANPVPADRRLPASFFLSAKPDWWGNTAWPAVGPDISGGGPGGHAFEIPAELCYAKLAREGNAMLSFDARRCYAAQPSPAPVPDVR